MAPRRIKAKHEERKILAYLLLPEVFEFGLVVSSSVESMRLPKLILTLPQPIGLRQQTGLESP